MPKTCLWRACGDKRNHHYFRIVIVHNTTVFMGTNMIGDAASKSEKWSNWPWKFKNGRVQYSSLILFQGRFWWFVIRDLWRHGISHIMVEELSIQPFVQQVQSSRANCEDMVFPKKMHSPQNISAANVSARHHKITLFAKIFVIVVALSNQGVGRFWVPVIYRERFAGSCWWHACARCLDFGMYVYIYKYPSLSHNHRRHLNALHV